MCQFGQNFNDHFTTVSLFEEIIHRDKEHENVFQFNTFSAPTSKAKIEPQKN